MAQNGLRTELVIQMSCRIATMKVSENYQENESLSLRTITKLIDFYSPEYKFLYDFRGNRSSLIRLNLYKIRIEIWRQSLNNQAIN